MDEIQQDTSEIPLRETILALINANSGLKAVELVCKVMGVVNPLMFKNIEYQDTLEQLLKEGEIVELEYILPQLNYRVKSLYFPKGTKFGSQITVRNAKQTSRL